MPCWVEEKDSVEWAVLSEVDRAFYYYCQATESLCNAIENRSAVGISYAKLLQSPRQVVASLLNLLRVEPGEMTESIVSQIRDPSQTRPASTLESGRFDKQSRLLTDRISGLLL